MCRGLRLDLGLGHSAGKSRDQQEDEDDVSKRTRARHAGGFESVARGTSLFARDFADLGGLAFSTTPGMAEETATSRIEPMLRFKCDSW